MTSPFLVHLSEATQFNKRETNLFYQAGHTVPSDFENKYISLRKNEERFYDNEIVAQLPLINHTHPLAKEWGIRKSTADRLIRYLKKRDFKTILEIGCGNGWLIHYLHQSLHVPCCGIDINETELIQASMVFKECKLLDFAYADVLSGSLDKLQSDVIVLASCIQYFPDVNTLLKKLQTLLTVRGEVHILDTPIYTATTAPEAKARSLSHFERQGMPGLKTYYHHHTWESLAGLHFDILYNPETVLNRIKGSVSPASPFPWFKIGKR